MHVSVEQLSPDIQYVRVIGKWENDQVMAAIKRYSPEIKRHLICDFNDADITQLSSEFFMTFPIIFKQNLINRQAGSKTAIIASGDFVFGMMNMYVAHANMSELPYVYRNYRTIQEALDWVLEG